MIIVTGSGRSGTSAVARVLHESGVPMGRDLIEPSEFNAKGYYEERAVVLLNERILTECGLQHYADGLSSRLIRWVRRLFGDTRLPERRRSAVSRGAVLAAAGKHATEMKRLAATIADPGGWKDPRFCWTLEAWAPYFPRKPRVIVCLRSPEAVSASVMRHFGLIDTEPGQLVEEGWTRRHTRLLELADESKKATGQLWAHEYESLLDTIERLGLEATSVEYDELISDPGPSVARLAAFVGHTLDPRYVEPALQHHRGTVPDRFAGLYERVRRLSDPAG